MVSIDGPQATNLPDDQKHRPRWLLHIQAQFWRSLMKIGMFLHRFAPPKPPPPKFSRTVHTTISEKPGTFQLHFYVPNDYTLQKKLRAKSYPVVVNFHGGGFTLGSSADDARWAQCVVSEVGAVVVGVDYRLAPEHPFPIAVEDGVDAVKYIAEHAAELNLDPDRMAISGFSSGANMTFTVPLLLQNQGIMVKAPLPNGNTQNDKAAPSPSSSDPNASVGPTKNNVRVGTTHELKIKALVAWYPPTDYTLSRTERRNTAIRTDQQLSATFTNLFDDSYLQPPTLDKENPILSPGVAPKEMLSELPNDIVLYTCEWDMLLREGEVFRDRLRNECGKNVVYYMVPGVPHGWDKAPNPLKVTPGVWEHYRRACRELRRLFHTGRRGSIVDEPPTEA